MVKMNIKTKSKFAIKNSKLFSLLLASFIFINLVSLAHAYENPFEVNLFLKYDKFYADAGDGIVTEILPYEKNTYYKYFLSSEDDDDISSYYIIHDVTNNISYSHEFDYYGEDITTVNYLYDYVLVFGFYEEEEQINDINNAIENNENVFSFCDNDGICEPCFEGLCPLVENSLVCADCASGSLDNYCDLKEDGICDPDCNNKEKECDDCKEGLCFTETEVFNDGVSESNGDQTCKSKKGIICSEGKECDQSTVFSSDGDYTCCLGSCVETKKRDDSIWLRRVNNGEIDLFTGIFEKENIPGGDVETEDEPITDMPINETTEDEPILELPSLVKNPYTNETADIPIIRVPDIYKETVELSNLIIVLLVALLSIFGFIVFEMKRSQIKNFNNNPLTAQLIGMKNQGMSKDQMANGLVSKGYTQKYYTNLVDYIYKKK